MRRVRGRPARAKRRRWNAHAAMTCRRRQHCEGDAASARRRLLMEGVDAGDRVVVSADRRDGDAVDLGTRRLAPVTEGAAEQEGGQREEGEQSDDAERGQGAAERLPPAHRTRHATQP